MVVVSWSQEVSSPVTPVRLFRALCLDSHNLFPKLMPKVFNNIKFIEGDHVSVGAIKQINFAEGSPYKYVKNKIEELDVKNFNCKYSIPEGDILGDKLDNVIHDIKFSPSGSGSVCNMTRHYQPKEGVVIDEEMLTKSKGKAYELFKEVEEYLLANPNAYA